jgi:hypothetical protein
MEKILMITSDLASFRQVGFVEPPRISPPSGPSDYGVGLKIDGKENRLLSNQVERADIEQIACFRIPLDEDLARKLTSAQSLSVTLDAPTFFGFHQANLNLEELDRMSIALAFKNCI